MTLSPLVYNLGHSLLRLIGLHNYLGIFPNFSEVNDKAFFTYSLSLSLSVLRKLMMKRSLETMRRRCWFISNSKLCSLATTIALVSWFVYHLLIILIIWQLLQAQHKFKYYVIVVKMDDCPLLKEMVNFVDSVSVYCIVVLRCVVLCLSCWSASLYCTRVMIYTIFWSHWHYWS